MSELVFFKHDQVWNDRNIISTHHAEAGYKRAVATIGAILTDLAAQIDDNIKTVIAGYHRGYSPTAVADQMVTTALDNLERWLPYNSGNGATDSARELADVMLKDYAGYGKQHWGLAYDYVASLEERTHDPIDVQQDINKRARAAANNIGSDVFISFGTYLPNASTVWGVDKEINILKEYRKAVVAALNARLKEFIVEKKEATA
ncbi:hypothetical protein ACSA002_1700 [Salmonella phage vB_SalM_SA002]|nr:hypothetical protein ACSA002_1700 [Salmonella phage vB_SalM_SA002]